MATCYWAGSALEVPGVWFYTVTAVAVGATYTVPGALASGSVVVTAITGDTTATIATKLAAALKASDLLGIADYDDVTASGSEVIIAGAIDGAPGYLPTIAGAAGGTVAAAGAATVRVSPVSPHSLGLAANWLSGAVPSADGDIATFPAGTPDVKYGIDDAVLSALDLVAIREAGGPAIGLPDFNQNGFREWQPRYLQATDWTWKIATAGGEPDLSIRIDGADGAGAVDVAGTGGTNVIVDYGSVDSATRVFRVNGSGLRVSLGEAGVASVESVSVAATGSRIEIVPGQKVSTLTLIDTQAVVAAVCTTTRVDGSSSVRFVPSSFATLGGAIAVDQGTVAIDAGGSFVVEIGSDGIVTLGGGTGPVTFTSCKVHEGGRLIDRSQRLVRPCAIDLIRTDAASDALDLGTHIRLTLGVIA